VRSRSNGNATLEVGVVGLGYWGPNRLRVLLDMEEVRIRWICDLDENRLSRSARRYPSARPTRNFEEILDDPSVDAVVIATPVFSHAALASKALYAGKHCFVEKPLAASSGEARYLTQLADGQDRVLMCGHTFLYSPPVRLVKELLSRGELGALHYISSSRVNLGPYRSDVSVVFDLGPHDFSILLYWLEALPETISVIGRDVISPGVPDFAFVNAIFGDGLVANVELSWLAPSKLRRTVLVGSEKMLVYEDGSAEPVRLYDSGIEYEDPETFGEYHLAYRTGDIVSPRVDTAEPIALELQDFVSATRGEAGALTRPDFAIDVIRMVEAAEASMNDSGQSVPVASEPSDVDARWR
jgi:predicted dehydrogenase